MAKNHPIIYPNCLLDLVYRRQMTSPKKSDDYLLFRDPALNRWVINFMISFAIDSIGLPVTLITKKLPF